MTQTEIEQNLSQLNSAESLGAAPADFTPRSPLQLLLESLRLYGRSLPEFTAIAGAGYLPLLALAVLVIAGFQVIPAGGPAQVAFAALATVGGAGLVMLVQAAITAAVALLVAQKYLHQPTSVGGALRRAVNHLGRLAAMIGIALVLAAAVVVVAGIPIAGALVAPALLVFVAILAAVVPAVITIERVPATWAMARSWGLVRCYLFRVFGVMAIFGLLGAVVFGLPTVLMLVVGLPFQLADIWLPLLLGVFYAPLLAVGAVLTYFDVRVRQESFSPQVLQQNLIDGMRIEPPQATLAAVATRTGRSGLFNLAEVGQLVAISIVTVGLIIGLAAVGGGALLTGPQLVESVKTANAIGMAAPDFRLNNLDGQPMTLADLHGKPTVINFWATWCPPCKEELPALEAANRLHGSRVNFVAVSVKEEQSTVSAFVEQYQLALPVLLDPSGLLVEPYQVRGLPTTIFLDAEGVIVNRHMGGLKDDSLADYLQSLLAEANAAGQ